MYVCVLKVERDSQTHRLALNMLVSIQEGTIANYLKIVGIKPELHVRTDSVR